MVRLDSLPVGRASLPLPWAILRMTVGKAGASMCRLGFFVPHKSTHNRTSPLVIEIQKMGYCRDLPHWVRQIPHRLRGGAVLNKLKAQRKALSFNLFAEREGFEPPDPLRSTVFKTAAFDHSAISPMSNFISPTPVFCEVERKGKDNF